MQNSTRNVIAHAYPTGILALCLLAGLMATSCSSVPTSPTEHDPSPLAIAAGDLTAPLELTGAGCSGAPAVGYGYCRKRQGEIAQDLVTVHAPLVKCEVEPCRVVRILYPGGDMALERVFEPGQTRLTVSWRELLGSETFEVEHIGYWTVVLSWRYQGPDGLEYKARAHGELRLRVYDASYVPLFGHGPPEVAWRWSTGGYRYELTTAGRAFVEEQPLQ